MELEELKASWSKLDKHLADSELVNTRLVKEMVAQKTKSGYDHIFRSNLYSFFVNVFIIAVLFPLIYKNTPISTTSFVIVEMAMLVGLIPAIRKITLLSGFDLEGKSCSELSRLVLQYKKIRHSEKIWGIFVVAFAFIAFYISELGFNQKAGYVLGSRVLVVVALTLLTFALAYVLALWQNRRHAQQMREIERGLEELKEFEE